MSTSLAPDPVEELDLPRSQLGSQPQHLLLTLLADHWYERTEPLPSAALVRLLGEFGISSGGARAALSRLSKRGLVETSRHGRCSYYGLTEAAAAVISEGARHIMQFGAHDQAWDGYWSCVGFTIPEAQRTVRPVLRTRLRWLGYAPLYDGLWVCPRPHDGVVEVLKELGIQLSTVFLSRVVGGGTDPISAWDLAVLSGAYEDFIAEFKGLRERVRAGQVTATDALVGRAKIMDAWRNLPNIDPDIPSEFLPADWPRTVARELFVEVYEGLGPLAEHRFRQILQGYAPELAQLVTRQRTDAFD